MFTATVEVKKSFVEKRINGKIVLNKKGKPVKSMVIHRKLYLDGVDPVFLITKFRIVPFNRTAEPGVKETKYSVKYIQVHKRNIWTGEILNPGVKWVKEGTYDQEGILEWLKFRVSDPAGALTALLTAMPPKKGSEELEEAA